MPVNAAQIRERLARVGAEISQLDQRLTAFRAEGNPDEDAHFFAWLNRGGELSSRALAELFDPDTVLLTRTLPAWVEDPSHSTIYTGATQGDDPRTVRMHGTSARHSTQSIDAAGVAPTSIPGAAQDHSAGPQPPIGPVPPANVALTKSPSGFRYVVLGTVGKGGMGTVHLAQDLELMRRVALKQLAPEIEGSSGRQRFLREVQITAQLDHPHIVPVYGMESALGAPAYAMKLVEGKTFSDLLGETETFYENGRKPDSEHSLPARLEHFLKVCDAMAYAHDKGVIHRDLKPANLMLGRHNEVYVMDWGICRVLRGAHVGEELDDPAAVPQSTASETQLGAVIGSPRYMSPEQAQGRNDELDPRSDVCALGLILFEMVTLRVPFDGRQPLEVLNNAALARRRSVVHAYRETVPRELVAIIEHATAAQPRDRYPGVRELAEDLRRYLRGEAVAARPDSPWQKALRTIARHRQIFLVGLLATVGLAAAAVAWQANRHQIDLAAAQAHERHVQQRVNAVSHQGDRLQTRLLDLQGMLEGLAAGAAQLLQHGGESAERLYWLDDYRTPGMQPPDFRLHAGYDEPVSLAHGAWLPAPGVARADVEPLARRLVRLRSYGNRLFARAAATLGSDPDNPGAAAATLRSNGIVGFLLVHERGLALSIPGKIFPAGYDPRSHTWYALARPHNEPAWGEPFKSATGDTLYLPLSMPIRGDDGAFLGAVSILLSVEHLASNLLVADSPGAASVTMLVDSDGHILATTGAVQLDAAHDDADLQLEKFPDEAAWREISLVDVGAVQSEVFEEPSLLVFDRIHPLEWTLVVVVPMTRIDE